MQFAIKQIHPEVKQYKVCYNELILSLVSPNAIIVYKWSCYHSNHFENLTGLEMQWQHLCTIISFGSLYYFWPNKIRGNQLNKLLFPPLFPVTFSVDSAILNLHQ